MKKIYLVRHAQSESNAHLSIRPNPVIRLTQLGMSEADRLCDWLLTHVCETIDGVFCSHYLRTAQTAEPYLAATSQTAGVIEELHEFDYLDFERIKDLQFDELIKIADEFWHIGDVHYKDGLATDSFANFVNRVQAVRQMFREWPDGNYIVFTHGMWIGMLLWQILHADGERVMDMNAFREYELAIRPKNCEVYLLTHIEQLELVTKVRVCDE